MVLKKMLCLSKVLCDQIVFNTEKHGHSGVLIEWVLTFENDCIV